MSITSGSASIRWVKSSHSGGDGGQCVEWSPTQTAATGSVPVRDSKRPNGPVLLLSQQAWTGLVTLARNTIL
jgi:hypothetical protein